MSAYNYFLLSFREPTKQNKRCFFFNLYSTKNHKGVWQVIFVLHYKAF